MHNYDQLGKVFHDFRTNRNISLKQVADENVSVSQISRFERGETDISLTKFLRMLDNMRVEMNEFLDTVRGYDKTETIRFMSQLIPLEYERDTAGFQRLFKEQKEKYERNQTDNRTGMIDSYHIVRIVHIVIKGLLHKCNSPTYFIKFFYIDFAL